MNRLLHARTALPWLAVLAASVPGAALVLISIGFHDRSWAMTSVSGGLLLLALPAAFVLDDPAAPVVGATPRFPWWDVTARLLTLVGLCCGIGAVAWCWNRFEPVPQPWLLALMPMCTAIVAVAAAAMLRRSGRSTPGEAVAGAVALVLVALSMFRPTLHTWELLPSPGGASAAEVAGWAGVAVFAVLCIAWAPSGRGTRTAVDV